MGQCGHSLPQLFLQNTALFAPGATSLESRWHAEGAPGSRRRQVGGDFRRKSEVEVGGSEASQGAGDKERAIISHRHFCSLIFLCFFNLTENQQEMCQKIAY